MALYDLYTQYQTPLSAEEAAHMEQAGEAAARMDADPTLSRVPGGYYNQKEGFTPHPVTAEHIGIAMGRAEAQFKGWPVMPEDAETPVRFPGIDPVGQYSVIDMKFAQRQARVEAALESRAPEVQAQVRSLLGAARQTPAVGQISLAMKETAKRHRVLTRASKLCLDPEGRRLLHEQARGMEADLAVEQYDKYLQGVEYAAGVRTGPVPREVQQFYRERLKLPLDLELAARARDASQIPQVIHMDFQDLDHKLLQQQFANPHNWGKAPPPPDRELVSLEEVSTAIPPYARATADRVLDPLFAGAEAATGGYVSRGDLICVDGKTIRETMFQQFQALGGGEGEQAFDRFYQENVRQMTNDLVSAALMAGKRVEAFVPDSQGRIPQEPVQITKTGYEPSPLKKVTLNVWERHFAKRGFFKEKAARAVEYQRFMAARERMRTYNIRGQFLSDAPTNAWVKEQFFSGWMADNGPLPTQVPNGYSVTRSACTTLAVCALAGQGRDMADILDPSKLTAEKQAAGREVLDRLVRGDQEWLAATLAGGGRALARQIDQMAGALDISDPRQMESPQARPLVFAAKVGFDAFQEMIHCRNEIVAQAERNAPGSGNRFYEETREQCYTMGAYVKYVTQGLDARRELMLGKTGNLTGRLNDVACEEFNYRLMAEKLRAQPDAPRSSLVDPLRVGALYASLPANRDFQAYADAVKHDPAQRADLARGLANGSFRQRLRLEIEMDPKQIRSGFAVAPAKDAAQARRADELEQAVRQNQSARPKGPSMGHR